MKQKVQYLKKNLTENLYRKMQLVEEIVNLKIDQFKSFGSKKIETKRFGEKTASETSGTISKGITCNWSPKRKDKKRKEQITVFEKIMIKNLHSSKAYIYWILVEQNNIRRYNDQKYLQIFER